MNNYYYRQNYFAYASQIVGVSHGGHIYRMADSGCLVTSFAMILSYFNDKAFYPDQMLAWMKANGGITPDGAAYWDALCKAAGNKLRVSLTPNAQPGEVTYGIRQVDYGSQHSHFVVDHPLQSGMVIDSLDGQVKPYDYYPTVKKAPYTGFNHFYMGKR